jgi:DNA-binding NtrC family response regulator
LKLLLVDDQQEITQVLTEGVEPAGYECVSFQNPRKALQRFKREPFDAVITDLRMPDMDGIQMLRAVRELRPETPVVILTGYADVQNAISAVNDGAFAFLQKPVKLSELLETLSRIERKIKSHRIIGKQISPSRVRDVWFQQLTAVSGVNVPLQPGDATPAAKSTKGRFTR